ncbi:15842_t:CDS:2, partial [Funneliformis caledonium]
MSKKELTKPTVNWAEVDKWIAEGKPFEEHDEILLFLNQEKKSENDLNTEPDDIKLTEAENQQMEELLTIVPGRRIERPGKKAILHLPQKEPKPPLVTTVNIVVKLLDQD